MTKLYELNTTIILNPNKISEIDSLDVDIFIKERLKNYINERENKFSFDDKESEYKISGLVSTSILVPIANF